ncbi:MAG: PG0541 family transporter-associated protein [Rikenellaceae bacterium]
MKAIFITYNQALTERVHDILDDNNVRGYTKWELTTGRGSEDGEPHLGTHAWPSMNSSILAIVKKSKVKPLLEALRAMDSTTSRQGSRAFVWDIEEVS